MDSPRWETRMVNEVEYKKLLADGWEPYQNHDDRRPGKFWARRRVDIDPQSAGDVAKAVQALEAINRTDRTLAQYYAEGCEILLGLVGDSKVSEAFRMVVRTRTARRGRNQEEQQQERDLENDRQPQAHRGARIATAPPDLSDDELDELTRPDSPGVEEPEKEQVEVDLDQADKI